ncbi:MAG: helix-turn-helix transcriptional regulator [Akkermansia muciniphila]|uniref:helix-turn-helix domain-containing protein n=1 Tax=Akkermansia muciniphila TaxID=239935 RepID=UPI001C05F4B7|nr:MULTISPECIES: helix-turn-helix transcriptional regulator [Akkermansia]MCI9205686.1 helix-turn-helix transcriptional regulator [Akkermansia muciniphila]QWP01728.1 helix-turn-helix transcriptional regulator [Akkermansia muciniphila]QWP44936.1 helix-turn-helix transcriptional regulator [Akkermansia muciniphila]WMB23244.1 helix-turn-helix transcriptional regulator [Akkermansia muciniphila]
MHAGWRYLSGQFEVPFRVNIITRLKRNQYVALDSMERICYTLNCGMDDVLEFIPEEKERQNNG